MPVTRSSCLLLALAISLGAQKQPFDVNALLKIARISEPQLSPDGKNVVFAVQSIDLNQNTKPKQIHIVPVSGGNFAESSNCGTSLAAKASCAISVTFTPQAQGPAQGWLTISDEGSQQRVPLSGVGR